MKFLIPKIFPTYFFRSSALASPSASCSSPRVLHGTPPTLSRSSALMTPAFESQFQRQVISECQKEASGLALKRKRPMMIDIPVASSVNFKVESSEGAVERVEVVEVDEDGYSVYCKRGRMGSMEDRYSAVIDLHDDSRQALKPEGQDVFLLRPQSQDSKVISASNATSTFILLLGELGR